MDKYLFLWRNSLTRVHTASLFGFRDHKELDIPHSVELLWTRDRPVAETSTREANNTHKRQSWPSGFETAIPASERPQTYALDRAATGIGLHKNYFKQTESRTDLCGL